MSGAVTDSPLILHGVTVNGGMATVEVRAGRIHRIEPAAADDKTAWLPPGLLMLPLFTDHHVHLDKAFPADRWIGRQAAATLLDQFALEKSLLAPLRAGQLERARTTARAMLACGTRRARVHVDLDPEIGVSHLETMLELRDELAGTLDIELAAFPQQGLLRSGSEKVVAHALAMGAEVVGAVDPFGVDQDADACLDAVFRLATAHGASVDIHLHDSKWLGCSTIERIADRTERFALQGKVAVSHAYCLGEIDESSVRRLAHRLAELAITIVTSVPIDSAMPPVALLTEAGVTVRLGTDHTGIDAWTPFGDPDLLRRGRRLAEKSGWTDDGRMRAAYRYFADGPLDFAAGDAADFQLVSALCPEHALATVPRRQLVLRGGRPVAGMLMEDREVLRGFGTAAQAVTEQ